MSKILAVFGATGQQGQSVVDYVYNDAELSKQYSLRAITRNVDSEEAQRLKQKAQVVKGDFSDSASLEIALKGVHMVFAMTMPSFTPNGLEEEFTSGKVIADACVKAGVEYIIFSTLPPVKQISGGKYTKVVHFDAKARIEDYIRGLSIHSAFFSPGFFMQNFTTIPFLSPQPDGNGKWVMKRHNSPTARTPMINIEDAGSFIGAILANPSEYESKTFCAATDLYSMEDVASLMAKATGKQVVYEQISQKDWEAMLPFGAQIFGETFSSPEEFGYYGPDSERLVQWAAQNARGKLTTLQEYLDTHPLKLE